MDISNNDSTKFSLNNFTINNDNDFEVILDNKNITLNHSENVFEDILLTIEERKKLQSSGKIGIISCCYSGFDDRQSYLKAIKQLHNKLLQLNNIYINYNGSIPIKPDEEIVNKVSALLSGKETNIKKYDLEGFVEEGNLFNMRKIIEKNSRLLYNKVSIKRIIS